MLTLAALALALAGALGGQLAATLASLALAAFAAGIAGSCAASAGHVGVAGRRVLITDHRGVYQGGAANTFCRRGPFLLRGDVAVNLGSARLPGFPRALESALARAGVDTADPPEPTTVAAVLLRGRHPLALGAAGAFLIALLALAAALS
ncbi:hypothetical protein HRUBRA_01539 [Pseudohaliea rubra DSM 19751]|uniref:Uncharacterized protein n=1 Tax=Pseudohaliea rubra DSM 19751 TaxID=1265313 RepID=A0A095VQX7_9GAMM|nr:hypothetical protein HRUBRA_01539 [Pseudohaliea rubra DSM 19751]